MHEFWYCNEICDTFDIDSLQYDYEDYLVCEYATK
jgi:hypothetical protein